MILSGYYQAARIAILLMFSGIVNI